MSIPLATARKYADKIVAELAPFCERVEIAGSIRRARPQVGDIDLVILPRDKAAIKARCRQSCQVGTDGEENFTCHLSNGVQLDIWFATPASHDLFQPIPSNWGSLLICRTGSLEHNIYLVEHAKKLGLRWSPYAGVYDSNFALLASETEESIFAALKLPFIPPELRDTGAIG